jgi:hypothetical protein
LPSPPPPPINKYANKQREKNGRDSPLQSVVPSFHCKSSTFFFFEVQSYIFSLPSSVFAAVAGSIPARSSSASSLLSAHACRAAASAEVPPARAEEAPAERLGRFHATATGLPSLAASLRARATEPSSSLPAEEPLPRSRVVAVALVREEGEEDEDEDEDDEAGAPRARAPNNASSLPSGAAHTSSCLPKSKTAKETARPAQSSEKARSGGGRVIFLFFFLFCFFLALFSLGMEKGKESKGKDFHRASMNALSDRSS